MAVTVLIVDDDVTLRWLLCKQLDKLNLQADSAATGQEALKRVEKWPYQIILMDIQMPEMNGYEATKAIREREKILMQDPVPIIAITALPESGPCFEAGMTDYLQKPIDIAKLETMLAKWMKPVQKERTR
jgi:CheY-like chemotaxis protein